MNTGTVRIIGGTWRSRKLNFPTSNGLRPTPDRVRETLFNWLAPVIVGARCLDAFSGSGALGFEALSRGAAHVLMLDQATAVINNLHAQARLLKTEHAQICKANIPAARLPEHLAAPPFDIIFLDPPFNKNLIRPTCDWLVQQNILAHHALIYIETETTLTPLPIPKHWKILKAMTTGQVNYYLLQIQTLEN